MALVPYTVENIAGSVRIVTWTPITNGDTGDPYLSPWYSDSSVQVFGTFGAGGNLRIQGTNETTPANYAPLADPQGNILDFTSAGMEQILENAYYIRPNVTAGDGTTSLTCKVMFVANRNLWRQQE